MALVGPFSCRWGWGRGAGGQWGKGSLEKAVGVSPAIFYLQLPSGAPKKEAAVCYWACRRGREWGGCWGVQLANGLRLMKWIMRGARTDFCVKKGDGGEKLLHINQLRPDLSGTDSLPRGQGPEDLQAGPTPPSQAAFLGILIILLLMINIYWDHVGHVLGQVTLMIYLIQCPKQLYEVDFVITHYTDEQTEMQRGEGPFLSHIVSKQWSWVSPVVWHQSLMDAVLVLTSRSRYECRYVWLQSGMQVYLQVCLTPVQSCLTSVSVLRREGTHLRGTCCVWGSGYSLHQACYISSVLFFNYF